MVPASIAPGPRPAGARLGGDPSGAAPPARDQAAPLAGLPRGAARRVPVQQFQFCARYAAWATHLPVTMRQVHRSGEKGFVTALIDGVRSIGPAVGGCIPFRREASLEKEGRWRPARRLLTS